MKRPKQKQIILEASEIRDQICDFILSKFYPGEGVNFAKDRPRILDWVVFEPARWLDERGVTITSQTYLEIFIDPKKGLLFEALRHGNTGQIRYRPAWLRQVIQSHLRIHEDEIYRRAKDSAALVDQTLTALGRIRGQTQPDPVRQMAQAAALLKPTRKPRAPLIHSTCTPVAAPQQDPQLSLL